MPEPEAPKSEEITDEKVGSLVSTVLDKMGVKDLPKLEITRAAADAARQAAEKVNAEARAGEQENLKNLVKTLTSFETLLRALANGQVQLTNDIHYIKSIIKKNAKGGRLAEALEASEPPVAVPNGKA